MESNSRLAQRKDVPSDVVELRPPAEPFCRLIDFRSRFTSIYTSGVAARYKAIGGRCGLSDVRAEALEMASYHHDLGKGSARAEFLEKPGALTARQFDPLQAHCCETYRILKAKVIPEGIVAWASYHLKRIDGWGYPFHLGGESLAPESRIVAVADVVSALTEGRPYRSGMDAARVARILRRIGSGALDGDLTALVGAHAADLSAERARARTRAKTAFEGFLGRISSPPADAACGAGGARPRARRHALAPTPVTGGSRLAVQGHAAPFSATGDTLASLDRVQHKAIVTIARP